MIWRKKAKQAISKLKNELPQKLQIHHIKYCKLLCNIIENYYLCSQKRNIQEEGVAYGIST